MRWSLFDEIVRMSWETLRSNKLRSILTVLGVVIGITSIVGMTSLIRGFDQSLRDSIKTIGSDTIFVAKFSAVSFASGAKFDELLKRPNMTPEDAKAIERDAPSIEAVSVILGQGGVSEQMSYRQPEDEEHADHRRGRQLSAHGETAGRDRAVFHGDRSPASIERRRARPGAVQGVVSGARPDRQEDSRGPRRVRSHRRAGEAAVARRFLHERRRNRRDSADDLPEAIRPAGGGLRPRRDSADRDWRAAARGRAAAAGHARGRGRDARAPWPAAGPAQRFRRRHAGRGAGDLGPDQPARRSSPWSCCRRSRCSSAASA